MSTYRIAVLTIARNRDEALDKAKKLSENSLIEEQHIFSSATVKDAANVTTRKGKAILCTAKRAQKMLVFEALDKIREAIRKKKTNEEMFEDMNVVKEGDGMFRHYCQRLTPYASTYVSVWCDDGGYLTPLTSDNRVEEWTKEAQSSVKGRDKVYVVDCYAYD